MKTKNITRIGFEAGRFLVVHRRQKRVVSAWCEACGASAHMITIEYAAALARINLQHLFREVENGSLHIIETTESAPLICLNSLCSLSTRTGELVTGDRGVREILQRK